MMQVPKRLREDLGGGMKEFTIHEASNFEGIEDMNSFLTSQERQAIILHLLHSLRAEAGGDSVSKLRMCSSHVFTNPEFSICNCFYVRKKNCLFKRK